MSFQLTPAMIEGVAQTGATYAETLAPMIAATDELRRPDLMERAVVGLRKSLAVVLAEMRRHGASDTDARSIEDAAAYGFSDRMTELLNP